MPARALNKLTVLLAFAGAGCVAPAAPGARSAGDAVDLGPAPGFALEGRPFCFAGANSYYPIYKPRVMVDDLFDAARSLGLGVMRVWGMLERGSLDGKVADADGAGHKDGVYFQYWDTARGRPAYNDGPNGLERLDYVLAAAAERDLKLIVVLLNNWRAFGGIDQYLLWYGRKKHHEFFVLPETRQAYRSWLEHVVTRRNTVNGRYYRDDPSILAWELANEPRCKNGSSFDSEAGWDTGTLGAWAREMSDFLKTLDPNHLVSVGDEGFLNQGGEHWAYRAEGGVDHEALTRLPSVDFGTFHLYPEDWGAAEGFGERWISDHLELARRIGKPIVLEEYGVSLTAGFERRRAAYQRWNEVLLEGGGAGLAWMLAARDERGFRYPDYDHFTFHRDDPTGSLLSTFARAVTQAPACKASPSWSREPSPFVSVARKQARVALGWVSEP